MWRGVFKSAVVCLALSYGLTDAHANLSYTSHKTDDGGSYLVISGTFENSDNVLALNKAIHDSGATVIFFNSTGGNVLKAIEIGRTIRALGISTMQIRGADCASACSLAFMGGVKRYAEPGSIGVHKSSFADTVGMSVEDAVSAVQQLTATVISYMTDMGVDPALLQLALQYDSTDIRYLSGSEMERFRLAVNIGAAGKGTQTSPEPSPPPPQNPPVASLAPTPATPKQAPPSLQIPMAKTGRVQHPKGKVDLKLGPDAGTRSVASVPNGTRIEIIGDTPKWFQVRTGKWTGYMHHSWVWVEQYQATPFGRKFIQVKSFDNFAETEAYIRQSPIPLAAYLANNGWFAITIDNAFSDHELAASLTSALIAKGAVPNDAVPTFGNAFVRKVCCTP